MAEHPFDDYEHFSNERELQSSFVVLGGYVKPAAVTGATQASVRRKTRSPVVALRRVAPGGRLVFLGISSFMRIKVQRVSLTVAATEAKILIERWRREYNTVRPHSALDYRPPAPETVSLVPLSGVMMSPALS